MRRHLREALRRQKDIISYNLAGLKYIKRQSDAELTAEFYEELDEGNLLGADIALDLLANRALHVVDLSAWIAVGAASLRR